MPDTEDPELVPIGPAAEAAGVSISTLRRWEAAGHITPARTPGGQRRYRLADVRALVAQPPAAP